MMKAKTEKGESVFHYVGMHKGKFILSSLLSCAGSAAGFAAYILIARIAIGIFLGTAEKKHCLVLVLMTILLWIAKVLLMSWSTSASHDATFLVIREIRTRLIDKLRRVSMGELLEQSSGKLKNTIVDKVGDLEHFLAHLIPEIVADLAIPLLLIAYLFHVDSKMTWLMLITIPVGLFFCCFMMIGYKEKFAKFLQAKKDVNQAVIEYVNGIEVIKTFNQTSNAYEKYAGAVYNNAACGYNSLKTSQVFMSLAMTAMEGVLILILPFGWKYYSAGTINAETLLTFVFLSLGIMRPLINAMFASETAEQMKALFEDVKYILELPELTGQTEPVPVDNLEIRLNDVSFSYSGSEAENALEHLNLTIREHETTALVGPSGSGKSTVAKLILGFWKPDSGQVTLGGNPVDSFPQDQLSDKIAYVSQDNYLLNATVMENIRVGRETATDEEVIEAAKQCGCHAFICGLENGYDTMVGDTGGHLSGGERQRIAIVRAMLKDAPVIILDEATAYTDPESETAIQNAISNLTKGKTLIVIAHRLSTIIHAEHIVVMNQGGIADEGTHSELFRRSSLYREMWKAYSAAEPEVQ